MYNILYINTQYMHIFRFIMYILFIKYMKIYENTTK